MTSRHFNLIALLSTIALTSGCGDDAKKDDDKKGPQRPEDTAGPADDTASGPDSDADGGPDADDTGTSETICDDAATVPGIDSCVSDRLMCNRKVLHTTEGGTNNFNSTHYTNWGCTNVPVGKYGGPERVYIFNHPGTGEVVIDLNSPCDDLNIIVVPW